ncbi:MAG: hypothetical protein ACLFWM_08310, partial [Actinomycetota bacterium]
RLYHSHVTVLEAVAAKEPPHMTDQERADLHAHLWKALEERSPRPARRSAPWWYRLVPAAAVLVVLVGVGAVLLGGRGGDSAMMAADTTAAAADGEADRATGDDAAELAPQADTFEDTGATEAPADTQAGADATTAAEESQDEVMGAGPSRLEEAAAVFRERVMADEATPTEGFDCEAPEGVDPPVLATEEATVGDEPVWLAAFGDPEEAPTVVVYSRPACEVLLVDEQAP